jgi:gamma-glutamyltranspeptidase/glutathione hydrolase
VSSAFPARGRGTAARSVVRSRHGMACAAQPLAALAGVDVLRAGGSAVDAAIAVNACLAVMEPTACGLGGDLFALLWDPATSRLHALDASGRAPLALTRDEVPPAADGTIPLHSPFAWSVPGCIDGWAELHARFGRLALKDVLAAAIAHAEEGFPLTPVIASDWERSARAFRGKPGFAEVFLRDGLAPRDGDVVRNPALARTLREVAGDPRGAFRGLVADAVVAFSREQGGFFWKEDFERNEPSWVEPISTTYRGVEAWELPPPGQGLAALQLLNLFECFDLGALGRGSADCWHLMIEAKKLAYADRARHYGDPAFARVPVHELLSKAYARGRADLVDPDRAMTTDPPGDPAALSRRETTYLCTADESGMMVSLIQSNYTGFGSGYCVPELGIGLQNRGGCFSLDPAHPNALEPGKRPFHTIIPGFLTVGGEPRVAFGLMGGDMQPQGHAQVVANLVDFGMNLQEAGDAPRFHHGGSSEPTGTRMKDGGVLHLEDVDDAIVEGLRRRGHRIEPATRGTFGGYQAIAKDPGTGCWLGATESRKDGCALGY